MGPLIEALKSRGKTGAIILMGLGGYLLAEHFIPNPPDPTLAEALSVFSLGLMGFGIRAKLG